MQEASSKPCLNPHPALMILHPLCKYLPRGGRDLGGITLPYTRSRPTSIGTGLPPSAAKAPGWRWAESRAYKLENFKQQQLSAGLPPPPGPPSPAVIAG